MTSAPPNLALRRCLGHVLLLLLFLCVCECVCVCVCVCFRVYEFVCELSFLSIVSCGELSNVRAPAHVCACACVCVLVCVLLCLLRASLRIAVLQTSVHATSYCSCFVSALTLEMEMHAHILLR